MDAGHNPNSGYLPFEERPVAYIPYEQVPERVMPPIPQPHYGYGSSDVRQGAPTMAYVAMGVTTLIGIGVIIFLMWKGKKLMELT